MYQINRKYLSKGVINLEEFYAKAEKNKTIDDVPKTLEEYKNTKRKVSKKPSKPKVAEDKQIRDKVSETELVGKENAYGPSAESAPIVEVEVSKEDPAPIVEESTIVSANEKEETKKIFMKSAEAELEEMLQDSK